MLRHINTYQLSIRISTYNIYIIKKRNTSILVVHTYNTYFAFLLCTISFLCISLFFFWTVRRHILACQDCVVLCKSMKGAIFFFSFLFLSLFFVYYCRDYTITVITVCTVRKSTLNNQIKPSSFFLLILIIDAQNFFTAA